MSDQRELLLAEWLNELPEPWRSKLGNMIEMNGALCEALAAAERERDEAREDADNSRADALNDLLKRKAWADRASEAESTVARLTGALKEFPSYAQHTGDCAVKYPAKGDCDCGLSDAYKKVREALASVPSQPSHPLDPSTEAS